LFEAHLLEIGLLGITLGVFGASEGSEEKRGRENSANGGAGERAKRAQKSGSCRWNPQPQSSPRSLCDQKPDSDVCCARERNRVKHFGTKTF